MSRIPTQEEYERNEFRKYFAQIEAIEKAPLSERREAMAEYRERLADCPEVVADHIDWIFDGSYGWAHQKKALQVLRSPRMNRVSALSQMVAMFDHNCPAAFAMKAYKSLTPEQRVKADTLIRAEIEYRDKKEKEDPVQ